MKQFDKFKDFFYLLLVIGRREIDMYSFVIDLQFSPCGYK